MTTQVSDNIIPAIDCQSMGTTGLVDYVRGPHWPYVPESTCFTARVERAEAIIIGRYGQAALTLFRKAVYGSRGPHIAL